MRAKQTTSRMREICRQIGLPEPVYQEEFGGFSVKFSKDVLDIAALPDYNLNERQTTSPKYLKAKRRISNRQYQELNEVSKGTATKELSAMVAVGLLDKVGTRGAGTYYRLRTP